MVLRRMAALVENFRIVGHPLFRRADLALFTRRFRPLSPVRDMIGSQAVKAQHALVRSGLPLASSGVWSDGTWTAIEAYPSPTRTSRCLTPGFTRLREEAWRRPTHSKNARQDLDDAVWCALVAAWWALSPQTFANPPDDPTTRQEGWIWLPKDCGPPIGKV